MTFRNSLLLTILFLSSFAPLNAISISSKEAREIGMKIWHNECKGSIAGLTSWNEGEDFASVGIGHFIWYPQGKVGHDTFPELLLFLKQHKKNIPAGILKGKSTVCPWNSRAEFKNAYARKPMADLRKFLAETIDLQIKFLIERLMKALPRMLKDLPWLQQARVKRQFYRVAKTPGGLYALVDYINFKGEGITAHEEYGGQKWGLLQVLQGMKGMALGKCVLEEFAQSAKAVLTERVHHAPNRAKEERWLVGWKNRINTYIQ